MDTTEISLDWKSPKDDETYICYVREWEYTANQKDLFNELKKLRDKYYQFGFVKNLQLREIYEKIINVLLRKDIL